jgi:hypothetical protein
MRKSVQMVDVPTDSEATLDLTGSNATPPFSWTIDGAPLKQNDKPVDPQATSVTVPPTIGGDNLYEVKDDTGTTFSAVVRWKPEVPVLPPSRRDPTTNVGLEPGRANASVIWNAVNDENEISYYEVDLKPRPSEAQLPRKLMQAARARRSKRVLSLDGLPPDFYTAQVRAVREGAYGAVSSDKATTNSGEVLPTGGPYKVWFRSVLFGIGAAALGGAIYLLVTDPHSGNKISLNGWALGIAALVTLFLVTMLLSFVRVHDLLAGADNRISTSRVNVALWTVAIAFGIATLAAFAFGAQQYNINNPCGIKTTKTTPKPPHDATVVGICVNGHALTSGQLGLDQTFKNGLAPNYLVLLGAPFVALAGASFIVNRQVDNGDRQKVPSVGPSSFTDALTNDDGSADLVDSQYLIFTGVLFFYFLTSFIPNPSVLPNLPWGLVGLTGVSAGTYLLNKSVTANGLTVQGLASPSVKQDDPARVLGLNFLPEGSAGLVNGGLAITLNGVTPTITEVSNTDVTFSTAGIPKNTYNVRLTTAANVSASAGSLTIT